MYTRADPRPVTMTRHLIGALLIACALCVTTPLAAQETALTLSQETLDLYNAQRADLNRKGMLVLASWAGANLVAGSAGWWLASEQRWKSFHQMNAMWNVVNLGIGLFGYRGAAKDGVTGQTFYESLTGGFGMERLLALNAGLDAGYIMLGAYLWERGRRLDDDRWRGYGQSVILQGAFLMGFDLVLMLRNKGLNEGLMMQIQQSAQGTPMAGFSYMF